MASLKRSILWLCKNSGPRLQADPDSFGLNQPQVAYVVPKDYGFGFRTADDRIWGLFANDTLSAKIYSDVETLTNQYGATLGYSL